MPTKTAEIPAMVYDTQGDPKNPGWLVQTRTAGWQPLGGEHDRNPSAEGKDIIPQAQRVVAYHDDGGPNPY